ncbi:hypothetical protein BHE74_00046694 [Ensete ventricosum]|nr:hypothetical protein BHE74_00046694 [Ensete ventricosum]
MYRSAIGPSEPLDHPLDGPLEEPSLNQGLSYWSVLGYRAQLSMIRYSVSSEEITHKRRIAWAILHPPAMDSMDEDQHQTLDSRFCLLSLLLPLLLYPSLG